MSKFYEHNQRFELKKMIRWEVGILKVKTGILRSTLAHWRRKMFCVYSTGGFGGSGGFDGSGGVAPEVEERAAAGEVAAASEAAAP